MDVKIKFHARYIFKIVNEKTIESVENIEDFKALVLLLIQSKSYKDLVLEGEIVNGIPVFSLSGVDVKSGISFILNRIRTLKDLSTGLGSISTKIYSIMKFGYNSYNVCFSPQEIDFEQDTVSFSTASRLLFVIEGYRVSPTVYGELYKLKLADIINGSYNELTNFPHDVRLLFDKVRAFLVENNFNIGISPQRYENGLRDLLDNPKLKNVIMLADGYHRVKAKGVDY